MLDEEVAGSRSFLLNAGKLDRARRREELGRPSLPGAVRK
jgi:hypothetical protein